MKIAASPLPILDVMSASSNNRGDADYGRAFESTIRDVAKDSPPAVKPRNEDRRPSDGSGDRQPASSAPAPRAPASDRHADSKSVTGKARDDQQAAKDPDTETDDAAGDPLAFLGRLLGGTTTPVAAVKEVDADAEKSGDERVIVVSLEAGATEEVAGEASGPGARGKVKLDVVHMETHFEPRSDAFVLVEGNDAQALQQATAEEGGEKLTFDQALARLSERKAGKAAAAGEDAKASSVETTAAKAAAVAADVAPQERIKERSRSKVAADETARKADLLSDEADSQVAVLVRKKDAAETAVDKISARLGRAASDAADAPKSGALAQKDGAGVLPLASMTGQVAGRVIDALGATLASQRPSDLPNEAYLRMTAGGAALKTLTIQLQPETLGKLDVSMRLVDGQLTLEIAATEAETAKVLAQDREGLRKLLQHAGFSIDEASITIVSRDNSAQPQVRAAAAGESAGAQQDSGNGGGSDPRNRGGEAEQQGRNAGRDERQQASDNRPRRASGNYL